MSILGIILFYYGIRLVKEPSTATIRLAIGTLTIIGVIQLGTYTSTIFPDLDEYFPIIIVTFISIPCYVTACVFVMKREGLYSSKGDILTKDFIKLLAYIVGITCFVLFRKFIPSDEDTILYIASDMWFMLLICGSILLGNIFLKGMVHYVNKTTPQVDGTKSIDTPARAL